MIDITLAVTYTRVLAAVCIFISAAEYVVIGSQFKGSGILSDRIYILNWVRGPRLLVALYRAIFSYRAAMVGHSIQMGLALCLLIPLEMRLYSFILLMIFFLQLRSFWQAPIGHDGSDQMLLVLLPALAIAYAFQLKGQGAWLALWFIVAQAALAYATSGIAKLISPIWRSGRSLHLIFNTASYGSSRVSGWLTKMPVLAIVGSWSIIVFECAMPLALVAPKSIMIGMLIVAASFHLGCALTMGLNCFFWAFVATYPMIYMVDVDRVSALSGLAGTHGDRIVLLWGGAFAVAVVGAVLVRYFDLLPRLRLTGVAER